MSPFPSRTASAFARSPNAPPPRLVPRSETVRQHILAGLYQTQIAKTIGITKGVVQRYTWQLRKSGRLPRPTLKRDAVARPIATGFGPKQIAQRLGLSIQNIYDHTHELRRAGNASAMSAPKMMDLLSKSAEFDGPKAYLKFSV